MKKITLLALLLPLSYTQCIPALESWGLDEKTIKYGILAGSATGLAVSYGLEYYVRSHPELPALENRFRDVLYDQSQLIPSDQRLFNRLNTMGKISSLLKAPCMIAGLTVLSIPKVQPFTSLNKLAIAYPIAYGLTHISSGLYTIYHEQLRLIRTFCLDNIEEYIENLPATENDIQISSDFGRSLEPYQKQMINNVKNQIILLYRALGNTYDEKQTMMDLLKNQTENINNNDYSNVPAELHQVTKNAFTALNTLVKEYSLLALKNNTLCYALPALNICAHITHPGTLLSLIPNLLIPPTTYYYFEKKYWANHLVGLHGNFSSTTPYEYACGDFIATKSIKLGIGYIIAAGWYMKSNVTD